jgi:hypothetical protein
VDSQAEFILGDYVGEAPVVASDIRGQERIELRGPLELVVAPGYPWDKSQPLRLKVAGVIFSSTEIGSWVIG